MDDVSDIDSPSPIHGAQGVPNGAQKGPQHFGYGSASSSGANVAGVTTQLVDTKFVNRPGKFSAELGKHDWKWTSWSFTFLNFMVCISPDYEEELEQAGNVRHTINMPTDPAMLHRSQNLVRHHGLIVRRQSLSHFEIHKGPERL